MSESTELPCTKNTMNLGEQLPQTTTMEPNDAANPIQGQRRRSVRGAHKLQGDWISEMPVERITAVNREPCTEQSKRKGAPVPLQDRPQAAGSGEVGQTCHDEADGDVSIRRRLVDRAKDEKNDAAREREELPGAKIFTRRIEEPHLRQSLVCPDA